MADLFTSLVAISPAHTKLDRGTAIPGTSPSMKDGIWNERSMAESGVGKKGHLITANTRFYWKLDESSGTATAVPSVGSWPLDTPIGVPTVDTGQIDNARHFNNTQIYGAIDPTVVAYMGSGPGPGWANFSIGFWINVPAAGFNGSGLAGIHGIMTLCDSGPVDAGDAALYMFLWNVTKGLNIGSSSQGGLSFENFFTDGFGGPLLSDQWVHVVFVANTVANNSILYRNGVAFGAPQGRQQITNVPTNPIWMLGRGGPAVASGGGNYALDDVWFENVAMSPAEVLADYQRGLGP